MNKISHIVRHPFRMMLCLVLVVIVGPGAGIAAAVVDSSCGMACCDSRMAGDMASPMAMSPDCCDRSPVSSCEQAPNDGPPLLATVTGRTLFTPDGTGAVVIHAAAPVHGAGNAWTAIRVPKFRSFRSPPLYLANASFLI